jgi:hypothetical protein
MVSDLEWLSPTRVTGLTAFGVSSIVCAAGWAHCRKRHAPGRLFALLAGAQLGLLLDMAFDWRWKLHDWWGRGALAFGVYDQRRLPQVLALAALLAAMILASVSIFRRFGHRAGAATAATGTTLSAGLWCGEVISYHYLDRVLYHLVGSVMVIGFVWVSLTLITCLGVWLEARSSAIS